MKKFDICFKVLILFVLAFIAVSLFKISCSLVSFNNEFISNIETINKNGLGSSIKPFVVHVETFAEYRTRMKILENNLNDKYIPIEKELIEFNNEIDIGG